MAIFIVNVTNLHISPLKMDVCRFVKHVVQGEKQEKEIVFL